MCELEKLKIARDSQMIMVQSQQTGIYGAIDLVLAAVVQRVHNASSTLRL